MDPESRGVEVRPKRSTSTERRSSAARRPAGSGNYYDVETAESYWVSGVKKKGGDRHWAGRGKITIDAGAVDEFLQITGATELDPSMFVVSTAIKPPDTKKFHDLENEQLMPPDGSV